MELLGKVLNAGKVPVWSYLMISYSPVCLVQPLPGLIERPSCE